MLRRFAEAEQRVREADAEARRLLGQDDLEGAARALEERAAARAEVALLEQEAGRQLIDLECRAFFAAIDNGALFGYPGEGNAWMKANVRDMVGEVAGLRGRFNLPD